ALLAGAIALGRGAGGKVAERAFVLAGLRRPVEAVLLAGLADDALGIDAVAADAFLGVFLLRIDIGQRGLDRAQVVAADAAEQDFVAAGRGVELPAAVLAHQRDRERPVLVADDELGLVSALRHHPVLGIVGVEHALARVGVSDVVAGGEEFGAARPEH